MDANTYMSNVLVHIKDKVDAKLLQVFQNILRKKKNITYHDINIILVQLMPRQIYNEWPDVYKFQPLVIPNTISFNNSYTSEWYYYNMNGYCSLKGKVYRFYTLRVLKRFHYKYTGFMSPDWIMVDEICITIVDENGCKIEQIVDQHTDIITNTSQNIHSIICSKRL